MVFLKHPASPMMQRLRRSGNIDAVPAVSLESIDLGRRRSFSLDDLGIDKSYPDNDLSKSTAPRLSDLDDTDEDLDDLPSQEETDADQLTLSLIRPSSQTTEPDQASSLSTIREGSPINSVEEWSPSPAEDDDKQSNSSIPDNRQASEDQNKNSRSLPKGLVPNLLSKWKNKMIKK